MTETLRVRAEGEQIRRGLLRDFPTRYVDRRGRRVVTGFEVISVLRDGRAEPHALEKLANGVRIRIGDPEVYLSPGEYTYTISYRTDRQLGFFADHDELYWNVTGNGWDFPIDAVSARCSCRATSTPRRSPSRPTPGRKGAQGRDWQADAGPSLATFRTHPWSRPARGTHDRRELAEGSRRRRRTSTSAPPTCCATRGRPPSRSAAWRCCCCTTRRCGIGSGVIRRSA